MREPIFLDNQSTTPVDPRVLKIVAEIMEKDFGNASSVDHVFGRRAAELVESAREEVSLLVNAEKGRVYFTSGSTEAINIAINHVARNAKRKPAQIVLSPVEHPAVLETCLSLQKQGVAHLSFIKVDSFGRIDFEDLKNLVETGADLVAVMAANNEIGNTYSVEKVAKLCNEFDVPYLCDASQAAGKVNIEFDGWQIDYLVVSGHKIYGPKGSGALVCKRRHLPAGLMHGGAQEQAVRPGTLNVPGIAGLGEACRLRRVEMDVDEPIIADKRDKLQVLLQAGISELKVNGDVGNRLSGSLHISIPGIPSDAVITRICDSLAVSRGASCSSGTEKPSHVLLAMGLSEEEMEGALRIGIGKFNSEADVIAASEILINAVREVRTKMSGVSCKT